MNESKQESKNGYKKELGYTGESFVIDKLKTNGFCLYKRNLTYIGSEIDIVMFKYDKDKYSLDIRIIEVKTRNGYEFDLINFNLPKKWLSIKKYMFKIKSEVEREFEILNYSGIHFDLALVKSKQGTLSMYSYIKDINLML